MERDCRSIALALILGVCSLSAQIPDEYYRYIKKADSLFNLKHYRASATEYSRAFETLGWKGFPEDRYKAACAWSLSGVPDSAVFNLERIAFRTGFADISRLTSDPRLATLSSHKNWLKVKGQVQLNADSVARTDQKLIHQLDSMVKLDQYWRLLYNRLSNGQVLSDSISAEAILEKIRETDSLNYLKARNIHLKYGFPGSDIVGVNGAYNYWLIVQHQDRHPTFQDSVLQDMEREAQIGKASWSNYAYLVDRVKVNTGKEQIYGTQMRLNKDQTSYEPQAVIEPEKLNERRKSVGLGTIEDYIDSMNSIYYGSLRKK